MTTTDHQMRLGSARRRQRASLAVAVVVVLIAGAVSFWIYRDQRREQEWKHGGDEVAVTATVAAVPGGPGFKRAMRTAGGDPDGVTLGEKQYFVVTVTWDGPTPPPEGSYEFILLDGRLTPPKPIRSAAGSSWSGQYDVLADRYSWLERTEPMLVDGSNVNEAEAVSTDASKTGQAVFTFFLGDIELPVTEPADDLILGMFLADGARSDDQVRWAKKVPLSDVASLAP